jgi:polyisoprenoid-binding protein YceI
MIRFVRLIVPQLACALLLVSAATLPGQYAVLEVDPAQTKVAFTLGAVLHTVHGTFQWKHGNLRFEPSTGKISGELVVDAASGQSGDAARDRRMHSAVLESERYPEIAFRPDRVDGKVAPQGRSQVQVHGIFSIHGADHEMVLPAEVEAGGGQYTCDLHFTVPYAKWGMKNPSTLILRVSDKVELEIHTIIRPAKP